MFPCANIKINTIKIINKRQCIKYIITCSALGLLWQEIFALCESNAKVCSYFPLQLSHEQENIAKTVFCLCTAAWIIHRCEGNINQAL